jgi:hypothetical protein
MNARKIKTVDITAKEWFDKINGNSYFSAIITINFGMKNSKTLYVPFQYGYGEHYRDMAFQEIKKQLGCFKNHDRYWNAYQSYNIIDRSFKHENCLKREVK